MPKLVVEPLLRYVDSDSATIWVDTDAACRVSVHAGQVESCAATFCVSGHHYAIVALRGLLSATAYTVKLDEHPVWPLDDGWPESVIRPYEPGSALSIVFGSCRAAAPLDDDLAGGLLSDP